MTTIITIGDVIEQRSGNKSLRSWRSTKYYRYLGRPTCCYNRVDDMAVLQWIFIHMWLAYPDRVDRAAGIGDASSQTYTPCPKHEDGTHEKGNSTDIFFYTFEHNCTQNGYGPNYTNIWKGEKLLPVFDLERNHELLEKINDCFPGSTIRVHQKIKRALEIWAGRELPYLHGDTVARWQHNRHIHVQLPGDVNWEAVLCTV